ncbi:unnamed protein product, partial [Oppiella nova]
MPKKTTKTYTLKEIREHNTRESVWLLIHNSVYDVTKFIDEHPGGEEVLLEQSGGEATDAFEEIGHSMDAKDMMSEYKIGELCSSDKTKMTAIGKNSTDSTPTVLSGYSKGWKSWALPLGFAVFASI